MTDHPEPEPGKSGEIVFQPEIACLCGSDVPYFVAKHPEYPLQVGLSLHEMVGTVLWADGSRFREGQKVLAVPTNHVGIFERFAITENFVVPLDLRRPLEEMILCQPLGTVLYGLRLLPNLLGWNVVVVGQGPIGQLFCGALRNLGARQIIGIDRIAARLSLSQRMGATAVINVEQEDPIAAVADLTGGTMADLVVEAVGHEHQALNLCIDLCRRLGRIHYFGVPPQIVDGIRWRDVMMKNLSFSTSLGPDFARDYPLAMQWIGEGRIDVRPLVTHSFPLSEIQTAFETFSDRKDGACKVLIRFPAAGTA
ncbi:MAG TPA: zinc-binding dehydrogenase [Terriglobia bacterium]|nr:zinc-binding dehydrogenase [Terriglobia bacterium]